MAHGTRGRLVRVAVTGFGVLLCTGLVGCMNGDKPKDIKSTKAPTPGLPNTPMLPANNGAVSKTGLPGSGLGAGQQSNNTLTPTPGFNTSSTRVGTTGINTNTTGTVPASYNNYGNAAGQPGVIGSPAQTGVVHPAGGTQTTNWASNPAGFNPPPPQLGEPVPPAPPLGPPPAFGSQSGEPFSPQPPQYNPAFGK